ncbi:MAG TPA: hypothetical protein VGI76_00015 [Solirubrobacteraceae bacterium]|jgi:hypothetical protein
MSKVTITLLASLAIMTAAVALVLSGSPPRIARANGPVAGNSLGVTQAEATICQANETLPAGASAIRVSIVAFLGSNMQVTVLQGGQPVTHGSRNPAWSGSTATIPIKPVDHTISNATLCIAFVPNSELLQIFGTRVTRANVRNQALYFKSNPRAPGLPIGRGTPLRGRVGVQYLAPGKGSWWSQIGSVTKHMGFGHFISGSWVALLAAALMAATGILTVRLALREQP